MKLYTSIFVAAEVNYLIARVVDEKSAYLKEFTPEWFATSLVLNLDHYKVTY
jgi:hypothetical protein